MEAILLSQSWEAALEVVFRPSEAVAVRVRHVRNRAGVVHNFQAHQVEAERPNIAIVSERRELPYLQADVYLPDHERHLVHRRSYLSVREVRVGADGNEDGVTLAITISIQGKQGEKTYRSSSWRSAWITVTHARRRRCSSKLRVLDKVHEFRVVVRSSLE